MKTQLKLQLVVKCNSRQAFIRNLNFLINAKTLILLLITFVINSQIYAQMNGWPLSSHASETVSSDQTWCEDRAHVTAMTTGSTTRTLTLTDFEGSFDYGDWVMVIQMHQTTGSFTGKYTLCEVTTSGNTAGPGATSIDVKPWIDGTSYTNSWPSFVLTTPADDIVQIVKVQRYWNLTVTGGVITCPAFDYAKGTGGILCVMVGNNFTMSGGYFNVSAKGFHVKYTGGGLGVGGNGASAASSYTATGTCAGSHSGSVNSTLYPLYSTAYAPNQTTPNVYGEPGAILDAPGPLTPIKTSDDGGFGGLASNPATNGTSTSGDDYFWFGHSNYSNNDLHIGCSGRCGVNSASGGGGGGWGGQGGAFSGGFPLGTPGTIGSAGENGGDAGAPGVGGGVLYLKVANSDLNFSNSQLRFIAKASDGGNGGNGGDGGMGGLGGIGAPGNCSPFTTSGGVGGFGDGGNGGNGGDGGRGGCGGTIWILKKSGGTHDNFSPFVNNATGNGGKGGSPGFRYTFTRTPRPVNYFPSLSTMPCNPGPTFTYGTAYRYCPPKVCDCDEVFRHLGVDMANNVSYTFMGGTLYRINSTTNPSQPPIFWDGVEILYYTRVLGSCSTTFECKMARNDYYIEFMDKVFGNEDLESYNGAGSLTSGVMTVGMNGYNTRLYSVDGHLIYEYDPDLDRLTDYDDLNNPYVTAHTCDETTGVLGGTNYLYGSGSGGGIPEIPTPDDSPYVGIPDGGNGSDGSPQYDGDFHEDATIPGPPLGNDNEGSNQGESDYQIHVNKHNSNLNNAVVDDANKYGSNLIVTNEINTINDYGIQTSVNQLTINNTKMYEGQIIVRNALGQEIYKGELDNSAISIPLPTGVYFITIFSNNKQYVIKIYISGS